jgi:hypothetical protein
MSFHFRFAVTTTVKSQNPQRDIVLADRWQEAVGKACFLRATCDHVTLELVNAVACERVSVPPPTKGQRVRVSQRLAA